MNKKELISSGIQSLEELQLRFRDRSVEATIYSNMLSTLLGDLVNVIKPNRCLVLGSNFGEITSKIDSAVDCLGVEQDINKVEISQYLRPDFKVVHAQPFEFNSDEKFDLVIAIPPLGNKRYDFEGKRQMSEILYIDKALQLLKQGGSFVFIIPDRFLSAKVSMDSRNLILNKYSLKRVISIPSRETIYSHSEFAILEISSNQNDETMYYKAKKEVKVQFSSPDFVVNSLEISDRWDYNYQNPVNKCYQEELRTLPCKRIKDLVEINDGLIVTKEHKFEDGEVRIIGLKNIKNGIVEYCADDMFVKMSFISKKNNCSILKRGDVLFSKMNIGGLAIGVFDSEKGICVANYQINIIRGVNAQYVATYLRTESGLKLFNKQLNRFSRGTIIPNIVRSDFEDIQIPILPISDLELASRSKLDKLSYKELLHLKERFDLLKIEYSALKNKSAASPHVEQLQGLQNTLQIILTNQKEHSKKLNIIESKIEDIKTVILNLSLDFKEIQNLPREVEEKISRLNKSLEEQISNLHFEQKQIDTYIKEIKNWFDYYDLLESKSKKYLPEAEYIFDHISKLENPDYSPFILQYCRALENELLSKIFRAYVQSLIDREVHFESQFAWDLGKKESGKPNDENTLKLSKHIQKCLTKNTDEWFFELGSMEVNLRYLTGKTIEKSPLLQDLKEFVLNRFEKELLNIEYLDEIKTIIRDYRNQSAHPNLMNTEKANTFHKQMKECLINLMENYKAR
jgi:chaperonin cofactor prefoldin